MITEFKRKEPSSFRRKGWKGKVIKKRKGGNKANLNGNKIASAEDTHEIKART